MFKSQLLSGLFVAGGVLALSTVSASADTTDLGSNHESHTVVSGDSFWKIASEYDVSRNINVMELMEDIANLNGKTINDTIMPGDVLYIPNTGEDVAPFVVTAPAPVVPQQEDTPAVVSQPVVEQAPVQQDVTPVAPVEQAPVSQPAVNVQYVTDTPAPQQSGSVYDQFIANGGTDAMWNAIVMPESGGNPTATNGQYSGLGQTNQSWGYGSVANQTQGMLDYAVSRYGSVDNAISFRQANNWW